MAIEFGKGITLAGGFDLGAKAPLDSRITVATLADRDAHVTGNRAYEGMLVFVEENKVTYQYVGDAEGNLSWKEFGFNLNDFQTQVVDNLETEDSTKALSAKQGKVLDEKIAAESERATNAEEANANAISALDTKVGDIPVDEEGNVVASTVVAYVDQKVSAEETRAKAAEQANADAIKAISDDYLVEADKTELQGNIDAVSGKVTTLIGEDVDKSVRTIANEELAKQLIAEGAKESLDTLTEIAAWIQSHPDDASAMSKAIDDLEALVGTLPEEITATTIVGYIQEVIAAEQKAREDADSELDERLQTIEAKFGDGEGNVASQIAQAKQEAIDASEDYADGLNTAMNTRVEALEAIDHDHANKAELDLIESGDKAKWDAAEAKAHEHSNKALLDTYTQTEADLADAVTKKHEHENADVLAGITSEKVASWDIAEENAKDFAEEKVNELANGAVADNTTAIEAINNADTGILATAKKYADDEDAKIESRVEAIETQLGDGEGSVTDQIADAKQEAVDASKEYTDSLAGNYATAAQGALADSALQKEDITTGTANGTIAIEGTDVAVAGLGSAAFVETTAFDAAGTAETKVNELANGQVATNKSDIEAIETSLAEGGATANAIADAKKAGTDAQAEVDALELVVGTPDEGKTVVEMIDALEEGAVKTNADNISTLQTDVASLKAVVHEEITKEELLALFESVEA